MKTAGLGCGLFVAATIILSAVLPKTGPDIAAYAALISIPVFGVCYFIENSDRFKWYIWGGIWAVAVALGLFFPIKSGKTAENGSAKTEKTSQSAARKSGKDAVTSEPGKQKPAQKQRTLEEALAELDGMVGLKEVKAEIHKLVDYTKIVQARKKQDRLMSCIPNRRRMGCGDIRMRRGTG